MSHYWCAAALHLNDYCNRQHHRTKQQYDVSQQRLIELQMRNYLAAQIQMMILLRTRFTKSCMKIV